MKLKMKDSAYVGPMYYAQDGTEYCYYGKAGMLVDGHISMCQIKKKECRGHGDFYTIIEHSWVDVYTGEGINKKMKSGFEVEDSEIGHSFRKVHHPSECNPW